uniref:SFRICE_022762 n=1 Tax=Spodoptera frugiperda TaxID=7108 RepID=A0A2H1WNC1_SPOFR
MLETHIHEQHSATHDAEMKLVEFLVKPLRYRKPNKFESGFPKNSYIPNPQKTGNILATPLVFLVAVGGGYCLPSASSEPTLLVPPAQASRRMSSDLVDKLRRQLMRDNYDYQNVNSNERRKQNATRMPAANAVRINGVNEIPISNS